MKRLCVNCWQLEQKCCCGNRKIEIVDKNIIDILTVLNWKGYKTRFSCGGHIEKSFIFIYVYFDNDYVFPDGLPNKFSYKKKILYYRNGKVKTKREKQKEINKKILILKNWVERLSFYIEKNNAKRKKG